MSFSKIEHFFPQIQVKTKKKVFNKNRTLFSSNLRSDVHPFKLLGVDANVDHSQIIGGIYPPIVSASLQGVHIFTKIITCRFR